MDTPKDLTETELKKVGLKIWLECERCGITWTPGTLPNGKLPEDYWHCPKKCNIRRLMH